MRHRITEHDGLTVAHRAVGGLWVFPHLQSAGRSPMSGSHKFSILTRSNATKIAESTGTSGIIGMRSASKLRGARLRLLRLHQREQDGFTNANASQRHEHSVDANADAPGRRHSVLKRSQELLIQAHRLDIASISQLALSE